MQVIIGVDPHKASHTAVAIDDREDELARLKVRSGRNQVDQLLAWAEPFPSRTWAIEGAEGLGYLLAQQLVAAGEHVVDVPATLAARTRVLGTGRSNKNDPNDALSVAVTALRTRGLRQVRPVGHSEVLRLLAKRNTDIGDTAPGSCRRLHALLVELAPGRNRQGNQRFRRRPVPRRGHPDHAGRAGPLRPGRRAARRHPPPRRPAQGIAQTDPRPRSPRRERRVTDLFGVGPIIAAMLIGYTGDIRRFANRDRYAAYNGTAPVEFSSGGRIVHRLSRRGNRTPQPRAPHGRDHASSANPTPRAAPTSTARRRGQDQEGSAPRAEAPHQQRRLPAPRRRRRHARG